MKHDCLVPPGPDPDVGDSAPGEFFEAPHVVLGFLRQVREAAAPGDVFVPGGHGFVDGHGVVEFRLGERHLVVPHPVHVVGHADGDFPNAGEHVQFGEEEVGEPIDPGCVAGDDRVVPAAAAFPPGVHPDFPAGGLQEFAPFVEEFSGEWPGPHPGGVGLHDPEGAGDAGGPHPGADAGTAGGRVRGGHKGVGAVVHVEHGGLAALHEHVFPGV